MSNYSYKLEVFRMHCIVYSLNDKYMMDIKLNKQNVRYVQLLMFVLSKNSNNPGPVPPHRQGCGGPCVYLQPLPARGDGRRPC